MATQERLLSAPALAKAHESYIEGFRQAERVIQAALPLAAAEIEGRRTIGKQDIYRLFLEPLHLRKRPHPSPLHFHQSFPLSFCPSSDVQPRRLLAIVEGPTGRGVAGGEQDIIHLARARDQRRRWQVRRDRRRGDRCLRPLPRPVRPCPLNLQALELPQTSPNSASPMFDDLKAIGLDVFTKKPTLLGHPAQREPPTAGHRPAGCGSGAVKGC